MKPFFLFSIAALAIIAIAVFLVVMIKRLPQLTRFLLIVMAPILFAFWYSLPLLVNVLIDTLFFVFLRELYKVETNPLIYSDGENELYERQDGDEYPELIDSDGIDWNAA